jgi:hypothetical protein
MMRDVDCASGAAIFGGDDVAKDRDGAESPRRQHGWEQGRVRSRPWTRRIVTGSCDVLQAPFDACRDDRQSG